MRRITCSVRLCPDIFKSEWDMDLVGREHVR